jgi:hypothetical protein
VHDEVVETIGGLPIQTVAIAIPVRRQNVSSALTRTVAVLTTVAGLVILGLRMLAGHSGSTAVRERAPVNTCGWQVEVAA